MQVLSWNLYHGRDFPPDPALFTLRSRLLRRTERNATHVQVNRSLLDEFARVLDGFEWDVALLQEAPPRWFGELRRRTGAGGVRTLTSRNVFPPLQGVLADWNPDLIASWEGGSNQILVRPPARIADHRERWARRAPPAPDAIDHVLVRGLETAEQPRRLAPERRELTEPDGRRLRLSDHRPIAARFVK